MQKVFKKIVVPLLLIAGAVIYSSSKAQADPGFDDDLKPAYKCKYTGSYTSSCFYDGYQIYRCQFSWQTTCGFNP